MLRIIHLGLGPLGQQIVRYALERGFIKVVAAVDPAPDKAGRDLGEVCGLKRLNVPVNAALEEALERARPEAAILSTVSSLKDLEPQVLGLVEAGIHVVSTCEELAFPFKTHPQIARRINKDCVANKVVCVGTGINPGYLMDFLPAVITGLCQRVDHIKVIRVQNASSRRVPFQRKIGAGLTLPQFHEQVAAGTLRHVGLVESMHMIADHIGWKLDRVSEDLVPVIADRDIMEGAMPITRGLACGVAQVGHGFMGDKEVITLQFKASVGEAESFDRIEISGEPPLVSTFPGGVHGDIASCAIMINALNSVMKSKPGLRTMLDLRPVGYFANG